MSTSEKNNGHQNHSKDEEIDSGKDFHKIQRLKLFNSFVELVELETALNDIEKAMDKIESQNSNIQTKLRDLLESNKQMAKEFSDVRRGMGNKLKDVAHDLEQAPGTAHDLAAVTSTTLNKLEQEMSSPTDNKNSK